MQYPAPVLPLSFFLDDNTKNCDVPGIAEQNGDTELIAAGTTPRDETTVATLAVGVQSPPRDGCKRMRANEDLVRIPETLHQDVLADEERKGSGYRSSGQELGPLDSGAFFRHDMKLVKAQTARHVCEYPKCNGKSYSRHEHLKRHHHE